MLQRGAVQCNAVEQQQGWPKRADGGASAIPDQGSRLVEVPALKEKGKGGAKERGGGR